MEENTVETRTETQPETTADLPATPLPAAPLPAADKEAKKSAKEVLKNYFTATRIAYIAIFTAMSLALRFLQFMMLPAVSFLKMDFSDVFVLVCGYALGPVAGAVTLVLKELIYGIIGSNTFFVGELANILITLPMLLITSVLYKKHKGIKPVIAAMAVACAVRLALCFPVNWLLNFPVFLGFDWAKGMKLFIDLWYWVMLFNLIKTLVLAVAVMLLYKPLSRLIQMTNEKFEKLKKPRKA